MRVFEPDVGIDAERLTLGLGRDTELEVDRIAIASTCFFEKRQGPRCAID